MAVEVVARDAGRRCPRCGHWLITDGRNLWCAFIGDRDERPCVYGIDAPVLLASLVVFGFDGAGI